MNIGSPPIYRPPADPSGPAGGRVFGGLWRLSLRFPRRTLWTVALLIAFFGLQSRHLALDPSIDFLSATDPIARADHWQQELFGPSLRLIAGLYVPMQEGGVLRPASLRALKALHRELEAEPGISRVSSLANAPALVPSEGGAAIGALLLPTESSLDAQALRQYFRQAPMQSALLLSPRESLTPLFIELAPDVDEAMLASRVLALARRMELLHPDGGDVLVVGPAIAETALARHVLNDLSRLVPFTALLIAVGLGLYLRRSIYLLVVVTHILALEALVLGTMAILGWEINLVSVLAPVIALPVGVADLLHLCVRLKSHRNAQESPSGSANALGLIHRAFKSLQSPMCITTATTALGFLGFMLSPVPAIRQFGAVLSLGASAALFLTFTLDAALLALFWRLPNRREKPRLENKLTLLERWITSLETSKRASWLQSRLALLVFLSSAALGAFALPNIHIDDTWLQNFDPGSQIRHDTALFESELIGTNILSVVFEADPAIPGSRQRVLDVVNRFTTDYLAVPGSRGVLSATLLARSLDPQQGSVWQQWAAPNLAAMKEAYQTWQRRGMALPAIGSLATPDLSQFRVQVFVLQLPYQELVDQVAKVNGHARGIAGPGVRVTLAGDLATNVHMVDQAVSGQTKSLLILALIVTLLLTVAGRSLSSGLLLSLPMALAILVSYSLLVATDLPYGIAVSMFPTLVVGLSVDFAIHLQASWQRGGRSEPNRARRVAVATRGILLNGVLWSMGFALLAMSALPPNRYLGILCATVIAASTCLTLWLIPVMARRVP